MAACTGAEEVGSDAEDVDDADADEQVFFDGAVGAAGDGSGENDPGEVVGQQGDVCCFESGLAAADSHRDADVGGG